MIDTIYACILFASLPILAGVVTYVWLAGNSRRTKFHQLQNDVKRLERHVAHYVAMRHEVESLDNRLCKLERKKEMKSKYGYEIGQLIEVSKDSGDWLPDKYIYINDGCDFGVIVVDHNDGDRFKNGEPFDSIYFPFHRPIQQKKRLRPWNPVEAIGKVVRHKKNYLRSHFRLICGTYDTHGAIVDQTSEHGWCGVYYKDLLENWETVDGKPCGVEETEGVVEPSPKNSIERAHPSEFGCILHEEKGQEDV